MTGSKKVPPPRVVRRIVQPKPDGQRGYAPPPRQTQQPSTGKPQGSKK